MYKYPSIEYYILLCAVCQQLFSFIFKYFQVPFFISNLNFYEVAHTGSGIIKRVFSSPIIKIRSQIIKIRNQNLKFRLQKLKFRNKSLAFSFKNDGF